MINIYIVESITPAPADASHVEFLLQWNKNWIMTRKKNKVLYPKAEKKIIKLRTTGGQLENRLWKADTLKNKFISISLKFFIHILYYINWKQNVELFLLRIWKQGIVADVALLTSSVSPRYKLAVISKNNGCPRSAVRGNEILVPKPEVRNTSKSLLLLRFPIGSKKLAKR